METIWEIKLSKRANGQYQVSAHGPEGKRTGRGDTPESAFAMCVAGFIYKPAFGPNWSWSTRPKTNEELTGRG